jgi:ribosomal protein L12E/L44/L45/RPP1/RPP2
MALDVAKFRAEAKAAGYIDSDIDEALGITAAPASAAVPPSPATASANTATAENDATFANQTEEMKKKFDENVKQTTTFPVQVGDFKADVPAVFGTPAGLGLIAAGLYGGYKATESAVKTGKKVYDSLRDKMSSGAQTAPTFAQELATDQTAINQTKTPFTAPTPEVPTVPLTTEVGKAPKEMPMIEQAAGTPEKKAVAEGRKQAAIVPPPAQPSLMTGSGMPAYQGTGPKGTKLSTNIPSLALVPEDKVFVPGGQFMDIIRNATGQEAYTGNLKKYGYPETPQKGYETARSINESLGRATREEAKAAGAALGENTKAITQKVGGIKGVKVGGVVGALISLTDLAKADTLRQGLGNVAEGLMPIGISPSELASGKLTEKQLKAYKEAQKLGSPYRSVPPPR